MLVMGTDNWKFHTKKDKIFEKKQEKKYLARAGFEPGSSCIVPGLPAKCLSIPITNCYWVKGQKGQQVLFHVDPLGYKNTAAVHDAEHIVFAGLFSQKSL